METKESKSKNNMRGISLITLVITIIILIILAAAVILTLNKNNPIENAREAMFKSDIKTIEEELSIYVATEMSKDIKGESINLNNTSTPSITDALSSVGKYVDKVEVVKGRLVYTGTVSKEIVWAKEIGIQTSVSKEGVNSPNLLQGMIPVYYDENTQSWKKADERNIDLNNLWFDYDENSKQWANVVTVEEANRSTYLNAGVGTEIPMNGSKI